jgi:hypothetical protein
MEYEGETVVPLRARSRAALLLLVYLCAFFFGLFHTWEGSPEPTHVCGATAHDVADSDDRAPAHDEDRCGLCHVLTAPRDLGVAFDGSFVFDQGDGRALARPVVTILSSVAPRANRPRGPPSG